MMKVIITILKLIFINSRYMMPRASRIKKLYSVNVADTLYALRCIFRDEPMKMFCTVFIVGNAFFSFTIKITESSIPVISNPFIYYENCIWYVLTTTTTVGYGDIRLYSHMGYLFNVFATIFGSLCISAILFLVTNLLSLNSKEMGGLTALKSVNSEILYK